jgi:hypothetical protein
LPIQPLAAETRPAALFKSVRPVSIVLIGGASLHKTQGEATSR